MAFDSTNRQTRLMIIQKLREYLKNNNIDYLWINTTDEFLVEYNELANSSRYFVTGFTGSTGDALLSQDNLWQFADGRYHEQAEKEVNPEFITVVKVQMGERVSDLMMERVKDGASVGIVVSKISLGFYNLLKMKLEAKGCRIVDLLKDPVELFADFKTSGGSGICKRVDESITGISADKKLSIFFNHIESNACYLETNLENIAYMTNLRQYKTPYSSVFKAKAVFEGGHGYIFTNEDTEEIGEKFKVFPLSYFKEFIKGKNNIFYNPENLNRADYLLIEGRAKEADYDFVAIMKSIKTHAEIEHLKSCFERTDKVVEKIGEIVCSETPVSEFELSEKVLEEYLNRGARQLSFKTILAAGANSSVIHYSHPSKEVFVKDGDFVLLDCGGHFEGGYSTDITRTFLRAKPDKLQKKVYTTVLKMFLNVYNYELKEDTNGQELDSLARKIADDSGLMGEFNFNHGLGHGVGINVHEHPPVLSGGPAGRNILRKNMVVTIEPGLYKAGFGGVRLENTVYVDEVNGKHKFCSFSKVKFQDNLIEQELLTDEEKLWLKNWQDEK